MKEKKWLKRVFAAFTAATLLAGCLAGCGGNKDGLVLEDPNKVPEEPYEIQWYLMADAQADVDLVEEELNKYLKDKINATVNITCLPSGQYSQKVGTMINANQYFDLCFVARWMLDYVNNARDGAFVALDDHMDTYFKETKAAFEESNTTAMLELSKVNGQLYAMPVNKEMATQYGWVYRKDIAEKYDIDMSKIKTFEDLEPVLKLVKENEPEMKYPLDMQKDTTPLSLYTVEGPVFKDGTYPDTEAVNVYATPEYKQACLTARDLYTKGYIRPDVLTATDHIQRMKEGKTFVELMPVKPGKAEEVFKGSDYPFAQAEVTDPYIDYLAGTGSMQAISSSSKNPVRVMRFLNLLYSDPYVVNLVLHGIEGKHYTKVSDKVVKHIPDSGYDMYSNSWTLGNVFNNYVLDTEDPNKLEALKDFNGLAKNAKINGYLGERDDAFEIISGNVSNAISKHNAQLVLGVVDIEENLPKFLEELEACEMDEYIKQYQARYDEYLKTLK